MVETNYRYDGITLPKVKQKSIDEYVENGTDPGHFLQSCLANDLQKTFAHADSWGVTLVPVIVKYIGNRLPMCCWGDWETVRSWKGMEHYRKEQENGQ